MSELRLPKIDAPTEKEQIVQIKNYLFQLVEQLQFVLNDVERRMEEKPK